MKKKRCDFIAWFLPLLLGGCTTTDIPLVSVGINEVYYLPRMKTLHLESAYTGATYRWSITTPAGNDSLVSTDRDYYFLAQHEGVYPVTFEIVDAVTPYRFSCTVHVMHEVVEYSPYINKVYEYRPAPGQFVNIMPLYEPGDTEEKMCRKATECISGTNEVMISLGSYGGYATFGFDHTVINVAGKRDFRIWGNAFYSEDSSWAEQYGGSAEPGIVKVAYDRNLNGKPDEDEWYELAGSEYAKATTLKEYQITYCRPDAQKRPVPDESGILTDTEYISWRDNRGETGFVAKNRFYDQSYYPAWLSNNELTFSGTRLPPNGVDEREDGSEWVLYAYPWGYVDNHPNQKVDLNSFDIGWAVDRNGNPVHLPGADFIRVYTGVRQYCGRLGETSTEIVRAEDLHIAVEVSPSSFN